MNVPRKILLTTIEYMADYATTLQCQDFPNYLRIRKVEAFMRVLMGVLKWEEREIKARFSYQWMDEDAPEFECGFGTCAA